MLANKGFCYSCGSYVQLDEVLRLSSEISHDNKVTPVSIYGDACDKVLRFEEPLLKLQNKSVILTHVRLSEVFIEGSFCVDSQSQVMGFHAVVEGGN